LRILLIRHGESEGNAAGVYQGHTDFSLSEKGRLQATFLAQNLSMARISIAAIYSSDLARAFETAEIIAKELQVPTVKKDKRLREFNLGIFEGKVIANMTREERDLLDSYFKDTSKRVPNGETVEEMKARIKSFFEELVINHHKEETIIIVAHGGTIFHILTSTLGFSRDAFPEWFANCAITCISKESQEDNWVIAYYNKDTISE